jgi:hypothetical protein
LSTSGGFGINAMSTRALASPLKRADNINNRMGSAHITNIKPVQRVRPTIINPSLRRIWISIYARTLTIRNHVVPGYELAATDKLLIRVLRVTSRA